MPHHHFDQLARLVDLTLVENLRQLLRDVPPALAGAPGGVGTIAAAVAPRVALRLATSVSPERVERQLAAAAVAVAGVGHHYIVCDAVGAEERG